LAGGKMEKGKERVKLRKNGGEKKEGIRRE
jgi:hypothetical protein